MCGPKISSQVLTQNLLSHVGMARRVNISGMAYLGTPWTSVHMITFFPEFAIREKRIWTAAKRNMMDWELQWGEYNYLLKHDLVAAALMAPPPQLPPNYDEDPLSPLNIFIID